MSVPFSKIKGAIVYRLAEFHQIPESLRDFIEHLIRKDRVADVGVYLITQSQSPQCTEVARGRIKTLRQSMTQLIQGMDGPEDEMTLLGNYQKITGRQFEAPEWLFEDKQALKRESSTAMQMIR